MEKVSDNLLPFSRNLQANGAQFFWDTLYMIKLNFEHNFQPNMSVMIEYIKQHYSVKAIC